MTPDASSRLPAAEPTDARGHSGSRRRPQRRLRGADRRRHRAGATVLAVLTTIALVSASVIAGLPAWSAPHQASGSGSARPGTHHPGPRPTGPAQPVEPALYVDPFSSTLQSAATLTGQARDDAVLLGSVPSARWFTSGTPAEVQAAVDTYVTGAAAAHAVPVLVAYNVPYRDCAQYSAGGALDTAAYHAWIDAFAAGIGGREAIVVLEPDGLGIIPWYTTVNGELEWCQPADVDPQTGASERFVQLNHAVDALGALPATTTYLDGTHNGWLGVGDVTDRLLKAGVERADGFFLNASNYQLSEKVTRYAGWISDCLALSTQTWWQPQWCASQYYPANPDDLSTWALSDAAFDQAFADTGLVRDRATQKHAVIDTSRNGQGPWTPPAGKYSDPEAWCNPPGRGLGTRPTLDTGDPVIDAFLWIKVPGESDGLCFRGTGGPLDPERGIADPPAGQWFAIQAAELIAAAVPPVTRPTCQVRAVVQDARHDRFATRVTLTNTGGTTVKGWTVRFTLATGQTVRGGWNATIRSDGPTVTATSERGNTRIRPGGSVTFGYRGTGTGATSLLVTLDGKPCTVR